VCCDGWYVPLFSRVGEHAKISIDKIDFCSFVVLKRVMHRIRTGSTRSESLEIGECKIPCYISNAKDDYRP
jgi:hypothetical protein